MEYIYKITNLVNDKFYIGKIKNVKIRWSQHKSNVGKKRHPLYDAIMKYGFENFSIEIIDKTDDDINELEKKWILETKAIELGYNLTEGGTGGDTFSKRDEISKNNTRKLLSEKSKISNDKNREIHRENTKKSWENEEYRKKVSDGMKRAWELDEHKTKVIETSKNQWKNNVYREKVSAGLKSVLKSPEKRKIWSECKQGKKNGRWIGYVVVVDLFNNTTKYESAVEASKTLGVSKIKIRNNCKYNETFERGPYKGWKFMYSTYL